MTTTEAPPDLSVAEQSLLADSYGAFLKIEGENILLADLALRFLARNLRFRNVVAVALRLAALPSRELDRLESAARDCWRKSADEERDLERIHGTLPPHPADAFPRPSWAQGRAA